MRYSDKEIDSLINDLLERQNKKSLSIANRSLMCTAADVINELRKSTQSHHKNSNIEYDRLLKIATKMHLWIFLHSGNEQVVYDGLGLTDEENMELGYSGQFVLKDKEN